MNDTGMSEGMLGLLGAVWAVLIALGIALATTGASRAGSRMASLVAARIAAIPAATAATILLMAVSIGVHVALVPAHLEEAPLIGIGFILGSAGLVVATGGAIAGVRGWRPLAAVTLAAMVVGYFVTRVSGLEEWDALGLGTKVAEIAAVGLLPWARPLGDPSTPVRHSPAIRLSGGI